MKGTAVNGASYVSQTLSEIFSWLPFKAGLGVIIMFVTEQFNINMDVVGGYIAIMSCLLATAFYRRFKHKDKEHTIYQIFMAWFCRLATHVIILALSGYLYQSAVIIFGFEFPMLNLILFVLMTTETVHIMDNMSDTGLPVPLWVRVIVTRSRQKGLAVLMTKIGVEKNVADQLVKNYDVFEEDLDNDKLFIPKRKADFPGLDSVCSNRDVSVRDSYSPGETESAGGALRDAVESDGGETKGT